LAVLEDSFFGTFRSLRLWFEKIFVESWSGRRGSNSQLSA